MRADPQTLTAKDGDDDATVAAVQYTEVKNSSSSGDHEATTSKVDDDKLLYCRQRGMGEEEAGALVVNGFCSKTCTWSLPSKPGARGHLA